MKRVPGRLLFLIVAALLTFAMSCGSLKKAAYTGGGAAAGAGLGLLGGPVGAVGGAAIGAVAGGAMADSDAFGSGEIVGEEALRKELERWRWRALAAESVADWRWTLLKIAGAAFSAYFAWRNREHLLAFGPGYWRRLAHAMLGVKLRGDVA